MKPDRELDIRIHTDVMGLNGASRHPKPTPEVPAYSTNPSDAKKVLDHLREYYGLELSVIPTKGGFLAFPDVKTEPDWKELGSSEAHAICLAALRAVGLHRQEFEYEQGSDG